MNGVPNLPNFLAEHMMLNPWKQKILSWLDTHSRTKFVLLTWKNTGFEILHNILNSHPEIVLHDDLFNTTDILTSYPDVLNLETPKSETRHENAKKWTVLSRDLNTMAFINYIWRGQVYDGIDVKDNAKCIGFISLLESWSDDSQFKVWNELLTNNPRVKKVVLWRKDVLSVYVLMLQELQSRKFIETLSGLKDTVYIKPEMLQTFIDRYRYMFQNVSPSTRNKNDTFCFTYEQMMENTEFEKKILPKLYEFLNVTPNRGVDLLREVAKQSQLHGKLDAFIENYDEVEFAFRHTNIELPRKKTYSKRTSLDCVDEKISGISLRKIRLLGQGRSWSILLPICSRVTSNFSHFKVGKIFPHSAKTSTLNADYFREFEEKFVWKRLEDFAESLSETANTLELRKTECVVGIDDDDKVFGSKEGVDRVQRLLPTSCLIVRVPKELYGKVCKIWNLLANHASNEFLVLLGDDVSLINIGWQRKIEARFEIISQKENLPFGAACVAFNDVSFPGFPTFPVIHRWHLEQFSSVLPPQFVNQGGDPFLFELYKRWNASTFVEDARLENGIGGSSQARYAKHAINWTSLILQSGLRKLQSHLEPRKARGICIDVVIPSFRLNNKKILSKILSLRATIPVYTKFWVVIDNKCEQNLLYIRDLALSFNSRTRDGNYYVSVISYGENRGASYARNVGYNNSFADWVLFLDDDVIPDTDVLDAYAGAIMRYPFAKVFVGMSEMPAPFNLWTRMVDASHVNFFYTIAERHPHPPWGVTANLLVCGSRFNHKIQFKSKFPRTGGGEDVDFIFQLKQHYEGTLKEKKKLVVSVPGAKVTHPWWRSGRVCYGQICGWARGDSICITEWPDKTFLVFPNWIETIFLISILTLVLNWSAAQLIKASITLVIFEIITKTLGIYLSKESSGHENILGKIPCYMGGSTVVMAQEAVRFVMCLFRLSLFSFSRRLDWFDGDIEGGIIEYKIRSLMKFLAMVGILIWFF